VNNKVSEESGLISDRSLKSGLVIYRGGGLREKKLRLEIIGADRVLHPEEEDELL
jgi:hypothetical protein